MAFFGFTNPLGWLAFLSLLPLILLYLIKPKPKEVDMPSLMFLEKHYLNKNAKGFLKHFIKDWLFILQLLILLLLSLFFVGPYLNVSSVSTGHVVTVIDTSASMQAENIFAKGKDYALDRLGEHNTIIKIGSEPAVLLEDGDRREAKQVLKNLEARGERSAIGESLQLAAEMLLEKEGEKQIVVVSDFMNTAGKDTTEALDFITANDIVLDIFPITRKDIENVGIVSLRPSEANSEVIVKNFCCSSKDMTVTINDEKYPLTLAVDSTESITFSPPLGKTSITLDVDDDFAVDNSAYLSNPILEKVEVLLLTTDASPYLSAALQASPSIDVTTKKPTANLGDYDVYIIHNIEEASESLVRKLKDKLGEGKSVIVHAEETMQGTYNGLLDFSIQQKKQGSDSVVEQESRFVEEINFGRIARVKDISCAGDACQGIFVSNKDVPVVMVQASRGGKLAYFGILEGESGFKNTPGYPLFWTRFIEHLAGYGGLGSVNLRTGSIIRFANDVNVVTPSNKKSKQTTITLDEPGFYTINNVVYGASLIDESESNVNNFQDTEEHLGIEETQQKVQRSIWKEIILLCLLFLIIEYYLRLYRLRRKKYYA